MNDPRIKVEDVSKTFRIPVGAPATLKHRILHPFERVQWRRFDALHDVSLDVADGEFFGIVGRNGCGKSTLLKVLAGIYRPDRGRVDVRGRVAPLIELGVGFNQELSARDNVFINGTLLGMTARELGRRFDEIVEFAELEGFMDLKLRNFSSGMVVRLAFAIAVLAEADILLADEVLAVGDERFQQKCFEVFRQRRAQGQTVVFVSHDMSAIQQFCQRAVLMHEGRIVHEGDPFSVTRAYSRINATDALDDDADEAQGGCVLHELRVERAFRPGEGVDSVEQGERIRLVASLEFPEGAENPSVALTIRDQLGSFAVRANTAWAGEDGEFGVVEPGGAREVSFEFDALLGKGAYTVRLGVAGRPDAVEPLGAWDHAAAFLVEAPVETLGILGVPIEVDVRNAESLRSS